MTGRIDITRLAFGTLRQWHWVSSAMCLVGMVLFAVTGITLNHAGDIEAQPQVRTVETVLTPGLLKNLQQRQDGLLPLSIRRWLLDVHGIVTPDEAAEWDDLEVYLGMPTPGGDAWLSIDLASGQLLYESTDRGWIAWLNDLHKGRNTGSAWRWFIDIFSAMCLVFSVSGLWLLARYARQRPSTWPLVLFGLVAPLIVIVLSVH